MREGLLRPIPPSKAKAEGSMADSLRWLSEAERNMGVESFRTSVMASYMAMFHAARSILFIDGLREKSHYCIARYIEDKYVRKGRLESKWIEILDHQRETRHNSQYDTGFSASLDDAEDALETAKSFVNRMQILLKERVR